MKVYRTDNMEAAALQMVERNDHCVLNIRYYNQRPIRFRLNDIRSIKGAVCRERDAIAPLMINKWRRDRGLLVYYPTQDFSIPQCDALLLVECPKQHITIESLSRSVKSELIIYRPPVWDLHEQSINKKYTTSETLKTLSPIMQALCGRELPDDLKLALDISKWPGDETAVFTEREIHNITGIPEPSVGRELRYKRGIMEISRLAPIIPPSEPALIDEYLKIESSPFELEGYKYVVFNRRNRAQAKLIKQGNVLELPRIYCVVHPDRVFNHDVRDAVANAHRAQWYKVKALVDNAPEYPIRRQLLADLARIRSERAARSLSLARHFGIDRLIPQAPTVAPVPASD